MRKDIKINVDTQTDGISLSSRRLGISSENLQGKIIFTPKPFIDGICRMYIEGYGTIEMDKQEDCYTLDIKSSLLITPHIDICFKITEPEKDNGVPIYATKIMHFEVLDTIESNEPIPEQYPQWKDVLDNYAEEKKGELDTYATEIQTDLKTYKKDLENEMSTTKDTLAGEITATATDETNKFNTNAESKTNAFNDNATEKTTDYNTNAETKLKEYNDNSTTKTEEYNTNATNKVEEFNNNVDSLENELTELASQMPWNTTEIQDSIHVEDSAKYSRNKLGVFGNLEQEVSEAGNNKFDGILESGNIGYETGLNEVSDSRVRSKNYIDVSGATKITIVAESEYETAISIGLRLYDKDYNYIGRNAVSDFTKSVSFNVSAALIDKTTVAKYCRFNVVDTDITKKFSVNINETLEYEEYIPNKPSIEYPSMPVVATGVQKITRCESNLYNVLDKRETNSAFSIGNDDWITLTVDNSQNTSITYKNFYKKASKKIKPNTKYYIVTEIKTVSGNGSLAVVSADSNSKGQFKNKVSYNFSDLTNNSIKITQTTSLENFAGCVTMLRTFATFSAGQSGSITFRLSLLEVEPTVETFVYKPYTEETFELDLGTAELCKIVDENNNVVAQDRVVYKDGKWQFEKNTYHRTLTENDNWQVSGNTYTTFYVASGNSPTPFNTGGNCNHFKWYKTIWRVDKIGYDMESGNIRFNLGSETKMTTVDKWKNWVKEHNLEIYYARKTVIYEDCTQEQSQVLDKLYKLSLQRGTNNIIVESENGVTTELQLTYMQDLMSQINELKQAMLNIGGN